MGVPDNGGVRNGRAFSIFPLGGARAANDGQLALETVDLQSDFPFVLLELAFAFAFGADAAGLLPKVTPGPGESRERIRHSGEIDLDARFAALRSGAENVENDFLPIGHGHAGERFPVALLRWTQLVVEDEDVALELLREIDNLLGFAGTDQVTRMVFAMINQLTFDNRDAESSDQFFELLEQTLRFGFLVGIAVRTDE